MSTDTVNRPAVPPGEFMGHPKALWQLSNVEMWERFSFYGMRALLAVYVATTFFGHLGAEANAQASLVYGGYTALVYATGIIGGYIAVMIITAFAPKEIVGIAYDSGGVTTSTVTVPLVTALGVGLATTIRGRNPLVDGFGLIAFASLLPMIFVMLYGMVFFR